MKLLNSKQIEKYHKDGFLVVKNVFTREECNNFKKILIKEIEKGKDILQKSLNKPEDVIDLNKIADVPRKINEGCLQDIAHRNSKFMSLAKDDRLISIIGQLFGNDVKTYCLYRSTSLFKNSKISSETFWHHDMPYWKGKPNKLSIWISLDKVTKQSGSLRYIPGTHSALYKNILEHGHKTERIADYWKGKFSNALAKKNIDESKKVIAEVEIGDMVIHHCCVLHGAEANILGKERYALIFTYQPGTDTAHHRNGPPELIEKKRINKFNKAI